MTNRYAIAILPVLCLALAGCNSSTAPKKPPSGTVYSQSNLTGASGGQETGTTVLLGTAIRSNASTGALALTKVTGSLDLATGKLTLDDGTYVMIDPDGADGFGVLTDGSATATTNADIGFSGDYAFAIAYDQSYSSGSSTFDSIGIYGAATNAKDVPSSGSAKYLGEASATVVTAANGYDMKNGTAQVSANFKTGLVDVEMKDFTITDQATNKAASGPLDQISVADMKIKNNQFSGGTMTMELNGREVLALGDAMTAHAEGAFFGFDTTYGGPDEVGATVLAQGNSGKLFGVLLAD